jgi:hypothetical protein
VTERKEIERINKREEAAGMERRERNREDNERKEAGGMEKRERKI